MSTDSSIEKENEKSSAQNLIEDAVKDKLFNKVFAYIFISFLISNWRDIFILLKSKDDVMYTLSMVFVGEKIPLFAFYLWCCGFNISPNVNFTNFYGDWHNIR